MKIQIEQPDLPVHVRAISSKSDAHRLLICAALADIQTELVCPDRNEDILATEGVLKALGANIDYEDGIYRITPVCDLPDQEVELNCGESGSTLRFILPVAAALGIRARLTGKGRLLARPMKPLIDCLCEHGARIQISSENISLDGRILPGVYAIAGNISSQYITGLLLALPLLCGRSEICLTSPLESAPYVDLTLDALSQFGVSIEKLPQKYMVSPTLLHSPGTVQAQGDWSNAAFWMACGAIGAHPVQIDGLDRRSRQGDRAICDLLTRFGADVVWNESTVTVSPGSLHGIDIQAQDIPDLVPVLAVVAAAAKGDTYITGAARLRMKESDRIETVCALLHALGGNVEPLPDGLCIHGNGFLRGGTVDGANDHRIVMSAAVAALLCKEPVIIQGAEAVSKSYPGFFDLYL